MLNKIEINNNIIIYTGAFDLKEDNKFITITFKQKELLIDIKTAVSSNNKTSKLLMVKELQYICQTSRVKSIIYPNGNISFRKLDSSNSELKTCYISIFDEFLICIAFDEIQPMLYKAELLNIYEIST